VAIRYQADNDLRGHFVRALRRREPAIDFQTAQAANLHGIDDLAVLRKAALEDRILISHDKRSMPQALADLIRQGIVSPGIFLVIPQNAEIQRVCESLILVWAASSSIEWRNRITKIPF
jgi:Domain of unknown function (DUF5615)